MHFRSGDSLESPVTGRRIVFRRTAAETGGRAVVIETLLAPNGFLPRLHVHPRQVERVEVLGGTVGVQVGRRRAVVGPGARLTISAGTPHRFWNAGDETAQLVTEITPALRFESFLAATAALAAAEGRGGGGLRERIVVAGEHFDTVRAVFPPAPAQRLAFALARALSR